MAKARYKTHLIVFFKKITLIKKKTNYTFHFIMKGPIKKFDPFGEAQEEQTSLHLHRLLILWKKNDS